MWNAVTLQLRRGLNAWTQACSARDRRVIHLPARRVDQHAPSAGALGQPDSLGRDRAHLRRPFQLPARAGRRSAVLEPTFDASDEAVGHIWVDPHWQYFCGRLYSWQALRLRGSGHRRDHRHTQGDCAPHGQPPAGEEPPASGEGGRGTRHCSAPELQPDSPEARRASRTLCPHQAVQAHEECRSDVPHARALPSGARLPGQSRATVGDLLARTGCILTQLTKNKNKLYALLAPEVECSSKGKARRPTSSA